MRILFVDDDMSLGSIVTLALEEAGHEVHYQTSLAGIRTAVKEWRPDMVVLDVEIGTQNGIEVMPELRAVAPEIPVLFVSSHPETENVAKALEAGAVNYLKKPFEMTELLAYIHRFGKTFRPKGIEIGMFLFRPEESLLMKGEMVVKRLSTFECKLLRALALNLNKMVPREELERELWDASHTGLNHEQGLNNYVGKLRRYLSEDSRVELENLPRKGYRLSVTV